MSAMRWALLLTACCGRLCEGQDTPCPDNGFAEKLGSADWRAVQLLMEEQLGTPAASRSSTFKTGCSWCLGALV